MVIKAKYIPNTRLKIIFLVLLLLISGRSIAQGEMDNWFFGQKAGLNFSSNTPQTILNSPINSIEACASISDSLGNLLFYSDAIKVYNRAHDVMTNGFLNTNGDNATQGVGIVPMPGAIDKYYVFSMQFTTTHYCALKYAVVDMSLDNGLGAVVEKDHILRDVITEKLTFVRQTASPNVWIIVHDYDSDRYSVFLLSASGFSEAKTYSTGIRQVGRYGYLQASPDGTMLAAAVKQDGFIEVCCFDPIEGEVTGSFQLNTPNVPYGICFSPDNTKLYATAGTPNHVYQFDLTLDKIDLIQKSRVQISSTPFVDYPGPTGALQLASNGKIYLARFETNTLAAIHQPNQSGTACGYIKNSVSLGATARSEHGLPNTGNLFLDQTPSNTLNCKELKERSQQFGCGGIVVTPNPTRSSISVKSLSDKISNIWVYTVSGRLLVSKTGVNSFETQMNEFQSFNAGTYIVRVAHGECIDQKKVVVIP